MKKSYLLVLVLLFLTSCDITINENINNQKDSAIEEYLNQLDRIDDVKYITSADDFAYVFSFNYIQYIDHDNKELGTFKQKIEFGFNDFTKPIILVTSGYYIGDDYYGTEIAKEMRANILAFQVKLLEYKDSLAPRFFNDALARGFVVTKVTTGGLDYDNAHLSVIESLDEELMEEVMTRIRTILDVTE